KGLGKKTFSALFSKMILCRGEDKPCGNCASCKKIDSLSHPDIKVIQGNGNKNSLHIDEIRVIKSDAYIKPNESEYKIYLIFDAQDMTIGAANALLKLLEEPPKHAVFILTCDNKRALPETIVSRCVDIPLSPVTDSECEQALRSLSDCSDENKIGSTAAFCMGNIGVGLDLLQNGISESAEISINLVKAIASPNEYDVLLELARCESDKKKMKTVFSGAVSFLRKALILKSNNELAENDDIIFACCNHLTLKQILGTIDVFLEAQQTVDKNVNLTLLLTWVSVKIKMIA
ncbi:MAG: polymerase subunit gamma and tau, partial [Oscillospiraceae bacterium]|nr:polymerase subunit gamma and tau [Oscillospiraceae bacterium]